MIRSSPSARASWMSSRSRSGTASAPPVAVTRQRVITSRAAARTLALGSSFSFATRGACSLASNLSRYFTAKRRTSELSLAVSGATCACASLAPISMSAWMQTGWSSGSLPRMWMTYGTARGSLIAAIASMAVSRTHQSGSPVAVCTSERSDLGSLMRASTLTAKRRITSDFSDRYATMCAVRCRPPSSMSASITRSRTHQSSSRR